MTNRERFQAVLHKRSVDRIPYMEWAIWWGDKTIARWQTEGLDPSIGTFELGEHFGLDAQRQFWLRSWKPGLPQPKTHSGGILANREDYLRVKEFLYPDTIDDIEALKVAAERQAKGELAIWLTLDGFFWFPRSLFGIEEHFYAFFDEPELMKQINEDLLASNIRLLEKFCEICKPDFVTIAEDMSYNHGPMLSRGLFDEFIRPYYERLLPELKKRDIVSVVDSDGDITELIPWYMAMDTCVDGFLPFERQAGCDLVKTREAHPDLIIIGGYDKLIMHLGEEAMRAEFERLLPVMKQGGYIVSVDHQTPPAVSLEQYKLYVKLLKEYCGKVNE